MKDLKKLKLKIQMIKNNKLIIFNNFIEKNIIKLNN